MPEWLRVGEIWTFMGFQFKKGKQFWFYSHIISSNLWLWIMALWLLCASYLSCLCHWGLEKARPPEWWRKWRQAVMPLSYSMNGEEKGLAQGPTPVSGGSAGKCTNSGETVCGRSGTALTFISWWGSGLHADFSLREATVTLSHWLHSGLCHPSRRWREKPGPFFSHREPPC